MPIILDNKVLSVVIEEPGKVYKGSRFDHSGNISRVTFDRRFNFCTTEKAVGFDPSSQGQGMYCEFGISEPVGYDDCAVGDWFPKIGTGLLKRKSEGSYDFFANFEIDPFEIRTEAEADSVTFTVLPRECRGYAMKLTRKISISGDCLLLNNTLENTGFRIIHTNEYCHNFMSVNGMPVGPGLQLSVPGKIMDPMEMVEAVNPGHVVKLNECVMEFTGQPAGDFFFSPFTDFNYHKGSWQITEKRTGLGVGEETDFIPEMMNVWGTTHVISPEIFIPIIVGAGETQYWQRKYRFFYL
jgi:hypothetical protein